VPKSAAEQLQAFSAVGTTLHGTAVFVPDVDEKYPWYPIDA
jgi:hypothetical protein